MQITDNTSIPTVITPILTDQKNEVRLFAATEYLLGKIEYVALKIMAPITSVISFINQPTQFFPKEKYSRMNFFAKAVEKTTDGITYVADKVENSALAVIHAVSTTYTFVTHPTKLISKEKYPRLFGAAKTAEMITEKVKTVAGYVLYGLTAVLLLFANSNLFVMGFVAGIYWGEKIDKVISKIGHVLKTRTLFAQVNLFVMVLLAPPIVMTLSSFFMGGHIGMKMVRDAPIEGKSTPIEGNC